MSDVPPEPSQPTGRESIMQTLQGSVGGFPVWTIALVVIALLYWYIKRRKSSSTSQTQSQSTQAAASSQGMQSNVGTAGVPVLVTGTPVIPTSNIDTQSQQMPLTQSDIASPTLSEGNNYTTASMTAANQTNADSLNTGNETGQPANGTATNVNAPSTGTGGATQ